jgi:hypothetical protein
MTTYYARPNLTGFGQSDGWSLTSGGPSAGVVLPNAADAVFDINSGPSRSIVAAQCRSIKTLGASPMTFTGSLVLNAAATSDLTGTLSIETIALTGSATLIAPGVSIGQVQLSSNGVLVAGSDLTIVGKIWCLNATGTGLAMGSYNITADALDWSYATTISLGTGTLTLTGTVPWQVNSNPVINNSAYTIKLANKSSAVKSFDPGGRTYASFWNDTAVPGSPTLGGVQFTTAVTFTGNYRASSGTVNLFAPSVNTTAGSFTLDGGGIPITVKSSSGGARATLVKTGGGPVDVNYCTIKDILGSGTFGAMWRALNSTDGGNNLNWTFVPNNSRLLMFF